MVTAERPLLTRLEEFLADPWGSVGDLAGQLAGLAVSWGLRLGAVAIPVGLAAVAAARGWRRWRHQRLTAAARLVAILAPPQVEPGAGDALWSNLAGLLRQRRGLDPRPHVSFEFLKGAQRAFMQLGGTREGDRRAGHVGAPSPTRPLRRRPARQVDPAPRAPSARCGRCSL
jgi:hypothetical protein